MIGKTMTAPRRPRKLRSFTAVYLLAGAVGLDALAAPLRAGTTEQIVIDRNSGLAIGGFDPVAYFVDAAGTVGNGMFEYNFGGAIWQFRNAGNRAAFIADPEVYLPRYGGYDPSAIMRGVAVPGEPRLWAIVGERLYLFATPQARELFAADPERMIAAAEQSWPSVRRALSP